MALGKWLGIEPSILLVEEPTRGVDVGARAEIYRHLRKLADQGLAIIFASSDNQEVLGLADTVATFFRGNIVRVCSAIEMEHAACLRDVTHPASPGFEGGGRVIAHLLGRLAPTDGPATEAQVAARRRRAFLFMGWGSSPCW